MLEKTFGLFYFLKQSKTKKNGYRYVYLRITVNGEPRELSIKRKWPIDRWDQSQGKAIGIREDAKNLNAYIETLSAKIYQAKLHLLETERKITAQSLKNYIIGNSENRTLIQLIISRQKRIQSILRKNNKYEICSIAVIGLVMPRLQNLSQSLFIFDFKSFDNITSLYFF